MDTKEAAELASDALAAIDRFAGHGDAHVAITAIRAILAAIKAYSMGQKTADEVRAELAGIPEVLSSHDAAADEALRDKFDRGGKP